MRPGTHSRTLSLWANGERVGRWTLPVRGPMELQYDLDWVRSGRGNPLSLSLPFNVHNEPLKGAAVAYYFNNLLPDSDAIRRRIAARFKTGSIEAFDLLREIGRDCVGVVQVLGEEELPARPDRIEAVPMDEAAIERQLQTVMAPDVVVAAEESGDDFRIALAGAQEKDAYLWWNGAWHKPRGSTPTTHIFKLPMGLVGGRRADFSTSVDNEWLCLRLLRAYGLRTAQAQIATFGVQRVLVVERFDRRWTDDGRLLRLPQEDFCQATGTSSRAKYESEGGPGLRTLFTLLQQSVTAQEDMRTLMAAQILFWLLRAPDGHAKNFSIRLLAGGGFQLTPLYDVMSAYPVIGSGPNQWSSRDVRLAMALLGRNRHYQVDTILRRHFNSTARQVGLGADTEGLIQAIIAATPDVVSEVQHELPSGFSQKVLDSVLGGLERAAAQLRRMLPD